MAAHARNSILGSEQLTHLSRPPEGHGCWSSYLGAVSVSAGMVLNVGQIYGKEYMINGSTIATAYAGGTVTVTASHATLPRRDLITIDTAGAVAVTAGTAATNPAPPAIGATKLALAEILVPAAATALVSGNLVDKRQLMSHPRLIVKAAQEDVTSSAVLQDDDDFVFFADAAARYIVEMHLRVTVATTPGIAFAWVGDLSGTASSPSYVAHLMDDGTTSQWSAITTTSVGGAGAISISGHGFTGEILVVKCHLAVGVTNGERYKFRWAQAVSNATTTTIFGSSLSHIIIYRLPV